MKKVLLSQEIHPSGRKLLEGKCEIIVAPDTTQETLIKYARDVDAIILRTTSRITKEVIDNARNLKIISRTGAGVDNVDVAAASEKGIMVCNLPMANNLSVCEHAIAMILHLSKQLSLMDRAVRTGQWNIRNSNAAVELEGKTLGIVGMGRIGSLVAKKCYHGLGMKILAYDPYVKEKFKDSEYEFADTLERIFAESDFITIHCPNTPETKGMISRELLYSMKPTAYIVNCARGGVIDEDALIEVLKEKRIAGAGIDVFQQEPPELNNELLKLDNVLLSPHSAAMTKEAAIRMAIEAAEAVVDFIEGRMPKYIYNLKDLKEKGFI